MSTQPAPCGCWLNDAGRGHWSGCNEVEPTVLPTLVERANHLLFALTTDALRV